MPLALRPRSLLALLFIALSCARTPAPTEPAAETPSVPVADAPETFTDAPTEPSTDAGAQPSTADAVARIRDEGLNRSQVMPTLSYLTDVIGPRLTGSPNLRRANEWTGKTLTGYGLSNAHDEAWGPFGRGWSLKRFSAQIVEPQTIPLIGAAKAWSPGFDAAVTADVIYIDPKTDADLKKYRGKLKGAIVLAFAPRELQPRFEPMATRVADAELLRLANHAGGSSVPPGLARGQTASERRALADPALQGRRADVPATTQATTVPATVPADPGELLRPIAPATRPATTRAGASRPASTLAAAPPNILKFLVEEGAAAMINPSSQGDGGTFFVAAAALPSTRASPSRDGGPRAWSPDAPKTIPQLTLAAEDYNRLVRMTRAGEKLKMQLDLQVQFHDADPMAYNTIAEIPGSDLKHEIVMLGAHLDSWQAGTGATDNATGVAACMEAVRIIKAAGLKPRRTIRIALWTGEEQGLYGSKAYVEKHFGKHADATPATRPTTTRATTVATTIPTTQATGGSDQAVLSSFTVQPSSLPTTRPTTTSRPVTRPVRQLQKRPEYDRLSVYFNLDNGAGKIRGIYLQGNESARPIFRRWLATFSDLGAETITLANTGGTDHIPFDAIGLPAFQFIQDPLEYWTRTHHSNQDTYDRVVADDLKQAATILATFTYNAAIADEKIPRKTAR